MVRWHETIRRVPHRKSGRRAFRAITVCFVALVAAVTVGLIGGLSARAQSAATLVVISATDMPLKQGDVIPADQPLHLTDGQAISLIGPSGRIVERSGPFSGLPMSDAEESDDAVLDSLQLLIRKRGEDTGDMGVTRSFRIEPQDPWLVDVSSSGTRCVREGEPVELWRADTSEDLTVSLSTGDGPWKTCTTWSAGEARLTAPPSVLTGEGAPLIVSVPGGRAELDLRTLPSSLSTDVSRLAWMVHVGCDGQAARLARRLR